MSHDHEALRLAVASLDFELSPSERAAACTTGLLDCADCAEIAAGHSRPRAGLLQRLPVRDASPDVRERVLRGALIAPHTRQWPVLLAAAALLGAAARRRPPPRAPSDRSRRSRSAETVAVRGAAGARGRRSRAALGRPGCRVAPTG